MMAATTPGDKTVVAAQAVSLVSFARNAIGVSMRDNPDSEAIADALDSELTV
jgi:hypothetical protein